MSAITQAELQPAIFRFRLGDFEVTRGWATQITIKESNWWFGACEGFDQARHRHKLMWLQGNLWRLNLSIRESR
jgi:hypothetical protein